MDAIELKRKKIAAEFLAQLSEAEKDCFFYRDESGHSYADLMNVSVKDEILKMKNSGNSE